MAPRRYPPCLFPDSKPSECFVPYQITQADIETARDVREHLLRDPHRPGYHFVVPEGLAHPADPNGAIFWQGNVHLGYIYQRHGEHCWGHVSSHDWLHWKHPPAVADPHGRQSRNRHLQRQLLPR